MRADGKRVKGASPMYTVAAYFMNKRYDAQNMIEVDIPLAPMSEYIRNKRREGRRVSHLGLILAAYTRVVAEFPYLNRFIVNKRAYARNEFAVGMVVLKPGETDGTMNKMYFELQDDIFTVQEKLDEYIRVNRKGGDTNKTDGAIRALLAVPGILTFGVGLFKLMDHLGLLPKAIIDASPFHTSMVISNLASIQTNHIYHHCYQFGTTGIIITIGVTKEIPHRHGANLSFERCMPLGVVMDERICSGSYFAAAFMRMKEYLKDPVLLEGPPAFPVVREWAKPGEYELRCAKRDYKKAKRAAQKHPDMCPAEKRVAQRLAKRDYKAAKRAARDIRRAARSAKKANK